MLRLFPQTTKENMGIWASDIIIFFTVAISLVCCNLLPNEIRSGKWIIAMEAGYTQYQMLFSKMLVYGGCSAFPAFIGYNLYYMLSGIFISNNYAPITSFCNSIMIAIAIFFITTLSITLSMIYKNHKMCIRDRAAADAGIRDAEPFFAHGVLTQGKIRPVDGFRAQVEKFNPTVIHAERFQDIPAFPGIHAVHRRIFCENPVDPCFLRLQPAGLAGKAHHLEPAVHTRYRCLPICLELMEKVFSAGGAEIQLPQTANTP